MVLVTGGTGLVGAHLILHLLNNGVSVRAIYRNEKTIQRTKTLFSLYKKESLFEKIDWIHADILDVPAMEIAFENVEYVYHCAALISFDPQDEDLLRKTNIEGTANIVNFCISNNVKKLCFVSSISALGDLKNNEKTITEETEWNPEKPHSDYAISKYGAEMEVWRGHQEGLNVIIVNPGVILGSTIWQEGSGKIFTQVQQGLSFYTKGITGFVAVNDVAKILIQLMNSNINNERFTLVAENIVYRDLLNSIANALTVKKPSIYADPILMGFLWKIDWFVATFFGQKRKLSRATAKASNSKNLYSNAKISNALGITFLDINQNIKEIAKFEG